MWYEKKEERDWTGVRSGRVCDYVWAVVEDSNEVRESQGVGKLERTYTLYTYAARLVYMDWVVRVNGRIRFL